MSKGRIHIDGEEWTYRVGRSYVVIKSPENKRFNVRPTDMTGVSSDDMDDAQCDGTPYGMVQPRHIKAWIEREVLGRDVPIPKVDMTNFLASHYR